MKIAIIGAGFSGLATAWHLTEAFKSPLEITVFDKNGIASGASGVSAGLLHPFTGKHAKLAKEGRQGFEETMKLLDIAKSHLSSPPYILTTILRLATQPEQAVSFQETARQYPNEIQWLDAKAIPEFLFGAPEIPGICIKKGAVVYPQSYLTGLGLACKSRGVIFRQEAIDDTETLSNFDHIIIAAGHDSTKFKELKEIKLNKIKGQILELEWPSTLPTLPYPLNSIIYCVMTPDQKSCLVGGTYERNYTSLEPDVEIAKKELLPKLAALYPPIAEAKIIGCRAGVRIFSRQWLPMVQKLNERVFAITAMGSKGLLYHALYAKKLCELMVQHI